MIGECMRLMRGKAHGGRLSLTASWRRHCPALWWTGCASSRCCSIFCSNAIKFTPPGGAVRISVERGPDGSLCFPVSDTGIGIAPEQIPVALEPFRQVASPFARNVEGTGLGLALVKSLIECHDGTLQNRKRAAQGHHGAADLSRGARSG